MAGLRFGAETPLTKPSGMSTCVPCHRRSAHTADRIEKKLTEAFGSGQRCKVVDESHQHEGHAGYRPGGQTHFRVYIVAKAFAGKTRVDRHRLVNAILSDELARRRARVALHTEAPGEDA